MLHRRQDEPDVQLDLSNRNSIKATHRLCLGAGGSLILWHGLRNYKHRRSGTHVTVRVRGTGLVRTPL